MSTAHPNSTRPGRSGSSRPGRRKPQGHPRPLGRRTAHLSVEPARHRGQSSGRGGNIGMEAAAKSAPDGRTLVIVDTGTLAMNPHLYDRTGYDALSDFVPVVRLVEAPLMLAVRADLAVRSVSRLIRLAREKPGQLSYGSPGVGSRLISLVNCSRERRRSTSRTFPTRVCHRPLHGSHGRPHRLHDRQCRSAGAAGCRRKNSRPGDHRPQAPRGRARRSDDGRGRLARI